MCPFHGNCIEGLCTNVAIKERLGLAEVGALADLTDDNEVWDLVGTYLGDFCANLFLTVSVERIIIGGGVCSRAVLMDKIRARFLASLNNYVQMPQITAENVGSFIVRPELEDVGTRAAATCSFEKSLQV